MDQNRRRFLRKVPDDLTFIQIERDEVGKVLNVSEGGLSFSSVTPVPRNLPVYFWFSFNLKDRIEAMGEVIWTDISRTVGGLRFTQLSQASREQIKQWLSQQQTEGPLEEIEIVLEEEVPEAESDELTAQLVIAGEPVRTRKNEPAPAPVPIKTREKKAGEPDRVARFVSKARAYRPIFSFESFGGKTAEEAKPAPLPVLSIEPPKPRANRPMFSMEIGPTQSVAARDAKFSPLSFRGIESLVELVPLQRYLSAKKRQLVCGVVLGIFLSAAVTLPVMKFWNSRAHADTKPAATDSTSVKNNAATQPPVTTPAVVSQAKPSYPVAGVFSSPIPLKNIPLKKETSILNAKSAPKDFYSKDLKNVATKATKQTGSTSVPVPSSNALSANKKSGTNPNQLWEAVQAGNSKAAVELAELYIKGDGVPQNCQQARVLLLVASEKRNTAAIKRLQQMDKGTACP
ncbi:MAG TPA: PilZ domain-containing protein [Candidatus Acidoferrum sp.]